VLGTSIKADYNRRWLQTEYSTAVRSARQAAKLKKYEAVKHIYPNLEFTPSTAATPREEHKEYYGTILPIEDPWWDSHTPPLDWGCECGIRNTDKDVTGVPVDIASVDPVFDNNPGKTAEIVNMKEHPYVKGVCSNYSACKYRNADITLAEPPNRPECRICLLVAEMYKNLAARKTKYNNYNSDQYEKVMYNKKNGGYLVIDKKRIEFSTKSKNEKLKFEKERSMSLNYAKAGYAIEMLEEIPGVPSPDVRFNTTKGDMKKISSHNNIVNEARDAIYKKKADIILFEFTVETKDIYLRLDRLRKMKIKAYYYFTGREDIIYRNF